MAIKILPESNYSYRILLKSEGQMLRFLQKSFLTNWTAMNFRIHHKGFTLVEIMIVVAIIALLAAIAIPNLLRAKVAANESAALARLKTLSTAAETYVMSNIGSYPGNEASLLGPTPPYINKALCAVTIAGYNVTCGFGSTDYTFTALPVPNQGVRTFTMRTGGSLTGQGL